MNRRWLENRLAPALVPGAVESLAGLPAEARGKIWVADLPEGLGRFLTLYDGSRRLPRSRTEGFQPAKRYPRTRPAGWRNRLVFPYGEVRGSVVQRNIFCSRQSGQNLLHEARRGGSRAAPLLRDCRADYNLYYNAADPLFVDVEAGDLRLKADSPARKLGFEPIDLSRVGPLTSPGSERPRCRRRVRLSTTHATRPAELWGIRRGPC